MKLFDVFATLALDKKDFDSGVKDAESKGEGLASKLGSSMGAGAVMMGNLMTKAVEAAGRAVMSLGKQGIDYNSQMENYATNFKVLLGSAEAATARVSELKAFAAKTPFSMGDLASATQTLLNFNVPADKTTEIMKMLGDASLGNAERFGRLSTAFGKATAQGKVTGEVVQQMIDAGFNPLLTISQSTGESMEELQKRMAKGKLSVNELEQALVTATSEGGQFYNGMEEASKTMSGLMSTLSDNANALVGRVMEPISKSLTETLLPKAIGFIDTLSSAFEKGGIDGMVEAAGDIISEVVSMFGSALPKFLSVGVSIVNGILKGIVKVLPVIAKGLADILPQLLSAISELLPSLIVALVDSVVAIADALAEQAPEIIPIVVDALINGLLSLLSNVDKLVQAGMGLIMGLMQGIMNAVPSLIDALPEILSGIWEGFASIFSGIVDMGANLIAMIWNALTGSSLTGDQVKEWFAGIFGKAAEVFNNLLDSGASLIANIWTAISGDTTSAEQVKGFFSNLGSQIGTAWDSIKSGAATVLSTISGALSGDTASQQAILTFFTDLWANITSAFSGAWQAGVDLIAGFGKGISDTVATTWDTIKGFFSDLWTGILDFFGIHSPSEEADKAGANIVTGFQQGIEGAKTDGWAAIKDVFQSIWDGILSIFGVDKNTEENKAAKQMGTDLMDGIQSGFSGDTTTTQEKAKLTAQAILTAFEVAFDIVEGVSNATKKMGAALVKGIGNGAAAEPFTKGAEILTNTLSGVESAFDMKGGGLFGGARYSNKFVDVGKSVAAGIAKGITDNQSVITDAAKKAAKAAYEAAMRALDSHSPSKLMAKVGKYFSQGFAIGIDSGTDEVVKSATNITRESVRAVSGSSSEDGAISTGGIVVNQTLQTVAMSPFEVAFQTANALEILRWNA